MSNKNLSPSIFRHLARFAPRTPLQATLAYGVFLLVAFALPVTLGSALTPSDTHAGTDTAGSTSGYYVSVTSSDTLSLDVNAVPGGVTASTHDTLSVSSNTPNGYKVYLSTPTNTAKSNYLCPAGVTPSDTDCFTPASSAATLTNFAANTWGYSMNDSTYQKVPLFGSGAAIINKTSATSESGVQTPIYFGLKADMALPSDTYTGTILYTAIADTSGTNRQTTISPTSTENIGGGDTLTVTIPYISSRPETEIKNATSITIGSTSCPVQSITKITSPYVGIQATCTMPAKAAGTYTVSVSISQAGGGSQAYTANESLEYIAPAPDMQDIASYCPGLATDNTIIMKDSRDGQRYTVGKLADGKCWMLDNLALDLTSSTVLNAMNENNTHASNTTLNYLRNGGGTTSDKYAITGVVNWTDSPTYASSYSYSDPLVNLTNKDVIPSDATSQAGQYKVGGYYNYCATTAGSYCYGNGTSAGTSSGNANEDICPKGWRLPTGASSGEFQTLYKNASYNTYANYRAALHLPLSGYFRDGSPDAQGSGGYWWSSTRSGIYNMFSLIVNPIYIFSSDFTFDRCRGLSIRCTSS